MRKYRILLLPTTVRKLFRKNLVLKGEKKLNLCSSICWPSVERLEVGLTFPMLQSAFHRGGECWDAAREGGREDERERRRNLP
jgi:hypothetical protein